MVNTLSGSVGDARARASIGTRLAETNGRTSGFDYIRITLASAVILLHSRGVTLGQKPNVTTVATLHGPLAVSAPLEQPIYWAILPCFFALSGFLVAGSLLRSRTTFEFVLLRVLRIVPALFVETVLAALILGPLVTEFPLKAYFAGREFWHYPLNIVGDIHYQLPGVFLHNPWPAIVNAQLWTIPAELFCYLTLVVVSLSGLVRIRSAIPVLSGLAIATLLVLAFGLHLQMPTRWSAGAAHVDAIDLVLTFLAGVTLFIWRDHLPWNGWLFAVMAVLSYALLYNGDLQYLATIPIAYVTVYIGLLDIPRTIITATGDYSYGVYLYGFPVQQLIAYAFPQNHLPILNFIGALAGSLALAAISWRLVESQVLAHRKSLISALYRQLEKTASMLSAMAKRV
jgi:peptidoglycan/LPS O-acetylase OafA/YrhL